MVYLSPRASAAETEALAEEARALPWVLGVETVAEEVARQRFQHLFPSLSELVEGGTQEPLPASLEVAFDPRRAEPQAFAAWIADWKQRPAVAMVDDDREWLAELATIVALARGLGLGLGLVLLAAAVFTIASVVRLTAYLYHDEISIMRLVGATEFFIRGPFYAEGLLQGLLGAVVASGGLFAAFHALAPRAAESAWGALVLGRFLPLSQLAALVALGAAAGLVGAVASLRREKLALVEE
jgi:cell division transport system permease protein